MSASSHYIRPVDLGALSGDGYRTQLLWNSDSCRWTASALSPGAEGPRLATFTVDRLLFVLEGELQVQLGAVQYAAGPESVVYAPAGAPHRFFNVGRDRVRLLELLAPSPALDEVPWRATDFTAGADGAFVRGVGDVEVDPKVKIFDRRLLVTKDDDADNILFYEATLKPGEGGFGLHTHSTVDQFYYVLEGQLTCQIGLEEYTIGPHTLAVLLRDMPHDPWNASTGVERHLNLVTPGAIPGQPGAHVPVKLKRKKDKGH